LTFNELHGVTSQKIRLFVTTAVRTSNYTGTDHDSNLDLPIYSGVVIDPESCSAVLCDGTEGGTWKREKRKRYYEEGAEEVKDIFGYERDKGTGRSDLRIRTGNSVA
jgi:hypothetical protein